LKKYQFFEYLLKLHKNIGIIDIIKRKVLYIMHRIKLLRVQNDITQIELAANLNVAQNTLSNWENGKFDPDNESLKKIAKYFSTTTDYILGLSDDPKPMGKKNENFQIQFQIQHSNLIDASELSEESRKDLEKYFNLLKMAEKMRMLNGTQAQK